MKKMILTALVAVVSLAASAQIWVGGEVGFSAQNTKLNGFKTNNEATFNFLPQVGYVLNDKFDIALTIGLKHKNYRNNEPATDYYDYGYYYGGEEFNANSFILNPYVRYKFAKAGDFTFFVDGGFSYEYTHISKVKDNINTWELGFKPGISYNLSDKVSLVAHVGKFAYGFSKQGDAKTNAIDLGLKGTDLSFGAYVSF